MQTALLEAEQKPLLLKTCDCGDGSPSIDTGTLQLNRVHGCLFFASLQRPLLQLSVQTLAILTFSSLLGLGQL